MKSNQLPWFQIPGNPYGNISQLAVAICRVCPDVYTSAKTMSTYLWTFFNRGSRPPRLIKAIEATVRADCTTEVAERLIASIHEMADQSTSTNEQVDSMGRIVDHRSFILNPLYRGLIQLTIEECLSPEQFDLILRIINETQIPFSKSACEEIADSVS